MALAVAASVFAQIAVITDGNAPGFRVPSNLVLDYHTSQHSSLSVAAGAVLAVFYRLMAATNIRVVITVAVLGEPTISLSLIWKLHASIGALSMPALGATLLGVSMASQASGLVPGWQCVMSVAAVWLSSVAGLVNLEIADDSPLIDVDVFNLAI